MSNELTFFHTNQRDTKKQKNSHENENGCQKKEQKRRAQLKCKIDKKR